MIAQDNIRAVLGVLKVVKGADYARSRVDDVDRKVATISTHLTGLHAPAATAIAVVAAALFGVLAGGALVAWGLAQLEVSAPRHARLVGAFTGLVAGAASALASRHAGSWWLFAPELVWAVGLAAAATCDAITQRVPTSLVRQSALLTAALVLGASAAGDQWRWAADAAFVALSAGAVFSFCWRFLGAGFGDVRIAILGGAGLVYPTHAGIVAGVAAIIVITLGQSLATLARGGTRRTLFPYGPAIAVAFLVAAVV